MQHELLALLRRVATPRLEVVAAPGILAADETAGVRIEPSARDAISCIFVARLDRGACMTLRSSLSADEWALLSACFPGGLS